MALSDRAAAAAPDAQPFVGAVSESAPKRKSPWPRRIAVRADDRPTRSLIY
jgi:hypothetical protein